MPTIDRLYKEWLAIAPGARSPSLEGTTLDGKKISLQDLKGKLIYVDVWATWCAPCLKEIPFSKQLQSKFSNERDIQFLNVSVDQNRSSWEEFVNSNSTWKGLHIIIDPEKRDEIYKNFRIYGIPEFILIDRSGNIIYTRAPRPSDKKIEDMIRKFLDENE